MASTVPTASFISNKVRGAVLCVCVLQAGCGVAVAWRRVALRSRLRARRCSGVVHESIACGERCSAATHAWPSASLPRGAALVVSCFRPRAGRVNRASHGISPLMPSCVSRHDCMCSERGCFCARSLGPPQHITEWSRQRQEARRRARLARLPPRRTPRRASAVAR